MQTLLNKPKWASCQHVVQQPVNQLSDAQLLARNRKTRQVPGVVIAFMAMMVAMAFLLDAYLVAACTSTMIPSLDDYTKKRKAIRKEMRKRNLR